MSDTSPTEKKPSNEGKKHLFQPGQSGNPAGRPAGSKNKTTILKQAIENNLIPELEKDVPLLYRQAVDMAMNGSETMMKFLLERIMTKASVDLGDMSKSAGGINIVIQGMEQPRASVEVVEEAEIIEETKP